MKEEQIVSIIRTHLADSDNSTSTHMQEAENYYFMRPRGDEVQGRSRVVANDLCAAVNHSVAEITTAFTGDRVIELEATGPDDEQQAQFETDAVIDFLMKYNNGEVNIQNAAKDALLHRNCWSTEYVEEYDEIDILEDVPADVLGEIPEDNIVKVSWYPGKKGGVVKELRLRYPRQKLCWDLIAPENIYYDRDWANFDLQRIPFLAIRYYSTRSELLEWYPEHEALISALPRTQRSQEAAARQEKYRTTRKATSDTSTDEIMWYECYMLIDFDGDNIAERRKVCMANWSILENDIATSIPVQTGVALPYPHKIEGVSFFDLLKQTQDISTGAYRGFLDNVATNNFNKVAYLKDKVDADDLANPDPSTPLQVDGVQNVAEAIMQMPGQDLSQGFLALIEHQRTMRTEQAGAGIQMASGEMQLASNQVGSEGLNRAYTAFEQFDQMILKNLGNTFLKPVFLYTHDLLRKYWKEPIAVSRGGNWEITNPREWQKREKIKLNLGMSVGQRMQQIGTLQYIVQIQTQLIAASMGNGILVNHDNVYRALKQIARLSEIENAEQYFVDPRSEESVQAQQQASEQAAQQREAQSNLTRKAIEMDEMKTVNELNKTKIDKQKHDDDILFKYKELATKTDVDEAKLTAEVMRGQKEGSEDTDKQSDTEGSTDETGE